MRIVQSIFKKANPQNSEVLKFRKSVKINMHDPIDIPLCNIGFDK